MRLLLILILWGSNIEAYASLKDDPTVHLKITSEHAEIEISGSFVPTLELYFAQAVQRLPKDLPLLLKLNSGGGMYTVGDKIITIIKNEIQQGREVNTYVGLYDECASMCVAVFAQGLKRIAHPSSAFMVHAARTQTLGLHLTSTAGYQSHLLHSVSQTWLNELTEQKVFKVFGAYWISANELFTENTGLITDLDQSVYYNTYEPQLPKISDHESQIDGSHYRVVTLFRPIDAIAVAAIKEALKDLEISSDLVISFNSIGSDNKAVDELVSLMEGEKERGRTLSMKVLHANICDDGCFKVFKVGQSRICNPGGGFILAGVNYSAEQLFDKEPEIFTRKLPRLEEIALPFDPLLGPK